MRSAEQIHHEWCGEDPGMLVTRQQVIDHYRSIQVEALEAAAALCRQFADERKNSGHDTTLHELEDAIRALGGDNEDTE